MRNLLDVNLLIALVWESHIHHAKAGAWFTGKRVVVCPLTQLGFLRLSTNKKVLNIPMRDARTALERFISENKVDTLAADLDALESHPRTSEEVTDHYLADLAVKHGLKLATLDANLKHPSVELVN